MSNKNIIANVMAYGDIHLWSKNYGAHRNYPEETLYCFEEVVKFAEEHKVTHAIHLGDFSYGRFHTLEYRLAVEDKLARLYAYTNGNSYSLRGNHDYAGYGMTEYEYYITKGLMKPSTNLKLGIVNISMIDYKKHLETEILPVSDDTISVVLTHDYFKFSDTKLPEYGNAILLDEFEQWFGVDYLICGHIHNYELFKGKVIKDSRSHDMVVCFPGCLSRPAYREGHMDEKGHIVLMTIFDDATMEIDFPEIPLWPLEKAFILEEKKIIEERKAVKRVDVSDIVNTLNSHERTIGNPEDIIMAKTDIPLKYREKAIELLQRAGE